MLINEILDLSRVEAGRYELKEESVSLAGVIEDCRHLLTIRAQKRGIEIIEVMSRISRASGRMSGPCGRSCSIS